MIAHVLLAAAAAECSPEARALFAKARTEPGATLRGKPLQSWLIEPGGRVTER